MCVMHYFLSWDHMQGAISDMILSDNTDLY